MCALGFDFKEYINKNNILFTNVDIINIKYHMLDSKMIQITISGSTYLCISLEYSFENCVSATNSISECSLDNNIEIADTIYQIFCSIDLSAFSLNDYIM
jgi:hypothetical protein